MARIAFVDKTYTVQNMLLAHILAHVLPQLVIKKYRFAGRYSCGRLKHSRFAETRQSTNSFAFLPLVALDNTSLGVVEYRLP